MKAWIAWIALGLCVQTCLGAESPFRLKISTPLQNTAEVNGVTQIKPLLLIPCDPDSRPRVLPESKNPIHWSKSRADFFLVLSNASNSPQVLSLRDPGNVKITLHTEDASPEGGGYHPKDFVYEIKTSKSSPLQFVYTLGVSDERVERLNLFDVPNLIAKPPDWYVAVEISKIKIDYVFEVEGAGVQSVSTGWVPVAVQALP